MNSRATATGGFPITMEYQWNAARKRIIILRSDNFPLRYCRSVASLFFDIDNTAAHTTAR